jgi:hypothetical protein
VLLLTLVPLWLVCFVLQLRAGVWGDGAFTGFAIFHASPTDVYPTVYWSRVPGLKVGDQVIRIGTTDLQEVSHVSFHAHTFAEADDGGTTRAGAEVTATATRCLSNLERFRRISWRGSSL